MQQFYYYTLYTIENFSLILLVAYVILSVLYDYNTTVYLNYTKTVNQALEKTFVRIFFRTFAFFCLVYVLIFAEMFFFRNASHFNLLLLENLYEYEFVYKSACCTYLIFLIILNLMVISYVDILCFKIPNKLLLLDVFLIFISFFKFNIMNGVLSLNDELYTKSFSCGNSVSCCDISCLSYCEIFSAIMCKILLSGLFSISIIGVGIIASFKKKLPMGFGDIKMIASSCFFCMLNKNFIGIPMYLSFIFKFVLLTCVFGLLTGFFMFLVKFCLRFLRICLKGDCCMSASTDMSTSNINVSVMSASGVSNNLTDLNGNSLRFFKAAIPLAPAILASRLLFVCF